MTWVSRFVDIAVAAAALAVFVVAGIPPPAGAQQPGRLYQVGFLWESPLVLPDAIDSFRRRLRDLGWVEGKNIVFEYRWSEGHYDHLNDLAEQLIRLNVDVIVAPSSVYVEAAKRATSTIPIVFAVHADPIGSGHVQSLARPGGNITGVALAMPETNVKLLELLKEAVPRLSRVAVLWNPATPSHGPGLHAVHDTGRALGVRIDPVAVQSETELESVFTAIVRDHDGGVLALSTPLFIAAAKPLAELALKHKLPTMFGPRVHAEAGGLLSYGPDRAALFSRTATYVDAILKGAKPADLPVQQPLNFEFVINLKTARALGLTIPRSLLERADVVLQ
jgi:putative ABC transport system substrate-binding protein